MQARELAQSFVSGSVLLKDVSQIKKNLIADQFEELYTVLRNLRLSAKIYDFL